MPFHAAKVTAWATESEVRLSLSRVGSGIWGEVEVQVEVPAAKFHLGEPSDSSGPFSPLPCLSPFCSGV